jgi:hypothetical protein
MADAVLFQASNEILLSKAESTNGTDPTPAAADLNVWVYEPKFTPTVEMDGGLKVATPDSGKYQDIPGAQSGEVEFYALFSPGASVIAASAANYTKFLTSCGSSLTAYTTKGHAFHPVKTKERSCMTHQIVSIARGGAPVGYSRKIVGAMGDATLECAGVGKPLKLSCKYKGKLGATADLSAGDLAALAVFTSADASNAYIATSMTVSVGAVALKVSSFKLDFGNKIEPEINTADATGYDFFAIAEREPKFSINPLVLPKATFDPLADWTGTTLKTITLNITGTVPITITICNAQCISKAEGDREGLKNFALNYKCLRNGIDGTLKVANAPLEAAWEILFGAKA